MNTMNPDKYIRKEIYDRIHNAEVDGIVVKCYDSRVTANDPEQYFLISTQLNQPNRTKCGRGWINSTEIQIIVRRPKNEGTRVFLDNLVNEVLVELDEFSLPVVSGFKVSLDDLTIDNEIVEETKSEMFYTKILRLETVIN